MSFRELSSDDISDKVSRVNAILVELSKELGDAELEEIAKSLDDVYSSGYRHGYAGILDVIQNIDEQQVGERQSSSDDGQEINGLVRLTDNLEKLKECIRKDPLHPDSTFNGIVRLSDHVNLEIHRLKDLQEQDYQKRQMTETIQVLLKESRDLASKVKIAQKNSEKIQMHMVAILGIFAAIVMAFSGGMNLLSGSISISGDSDLCNVVFAVLLCGIILFNIIAFLIGSIMAIIRPATCDKDIQPQKTALDSRLLIGFNGLMVALLAVDVVVMIWS